MASSFLYALNHGTQAKHLTSAGSQNYWAIVHCNTGIDGWYQGVTKRCRLSLLTNSALIIRVQMPGGGGVAGFQPMSTAVHIMWLGARIKFGDLPPYLTYGWYHGRMNYKDTEPLMSALSWPVNWVCSIVFNRFYRLEIHSLMVGIFHSACELFPPWMMELYLCTVAPLPSLWPPLPKLNVQYIQTVFGCGGGGGGVELCCRPYSARVLHSLSDQIKNLQNCFTTLNKMTRKDDI